ncbi:MAG: hypothetical protein LBO67_00975 [Spirochaetaceae bacterium]|jgi:hypothetical protein|nr:hypothetical protein [Spirochaetaceae bacterium]
MKTIFRAFVLSILIFSSCASNSPAQDTPIGQELPAEADEKAEPEEKTAEPEAETAEPEEKPAPEPQALAVQEVPEPTIPPSTALNPTLPEPERNLQQETESPFVVEPEPLFIEPEPAPRWSQAERESLLQKVKTELEKFPSPVQAEIERVFTELTGQTFSAFMEQVRTFEADPDNADPELLDAIATGRTELVRTVNTIVERRSEQAKKAEPFFWNDDDKKNFANAAETLVNGIEALSTQEYNRLAYFFNDATNGKRLITLINELDAFSKAVRDNPQAVGTDTTTAIIDGLDLLVRVMNKLSD